MELFGFELSWSYILILPLCVGGLVVVMFLQWWERRLLGFWQYHSDPNLAGRGGIL